jgi:hypothetical protein
MGASSSARLAVSAGSAALTVDATPRPRPGWRLPVPPHEEERPSRVHLVDGVACDLDHQQEVFVEGVARMREVQVDEAPVVRPTRCDHHVIERGRQAPEELLEGSRLRGVEGCGAERADLIGGFV